MAYDVNLPLYLRIEKVGTVYTFLYKPDTGDPEADAQVAWTALGTYTLDEPVQYVGLQVRTNDSTSGDVILDVDYFRLERYGPAAPARLLGNLRSYWGIENSLHFRRDVTLHEDHLRMTKPNMARNMACIHNLIIGLLIGKKKYRYLPSARRFYAAHPSEALALITRL